MHPLGGVGASSIGKGPDSPSDSSTVASPVGLNLSPLASPLNMSSSGPLSPPKSGPMHSRVDVDQQPQNHRKMNTPPKDRRTCHINAEQKRRCNIKNGFDMLHSLIPQLHQNPNAKVKHEMQFICSHFVHLDLVLCIF